MGLGSHLTGRVIQGGKVYEPGTKVSDLDLSDEEKARLERLDLTGSAKEAAEAAPDDDEE